jgi:hypothetical protein
MRRRVAPSTGRRHSNAYFVAQVQSVFEAAPRLKRLVKERIALDLRSQTAQIGNWNGRRVRQRIGQGRRLRQAPESALQATTVSFTLPLWM